MPHEGSYKDEDRMKSRMRLDAGDAEALSEKAKSGDLLDGQEEIDEVTLDLDKEVFPEISKDDVGDKVVVVLVGTVWKNYDEAVTVEFNRASVVHGKPPLGSGERFRKLESELESKGGRNPAALSSWIGRKKWGAKRFAKLSAHGRK